MKKEFQIIAELIQKNKRVLDVGCGDGILMKYLKDNKNIDTRGLEISKKMFKYVFQKVYQLLKEMLKKIYSNFQTLLLTM